jgi:hypothetical protein
VLELRIADLLGSAFNVPSAVSAAAFARAASAFEGISTSWQRLLCVNMVYRIRTRYQDRI